MRWRQFFTPVKSMAAPDAKAYMDSLSLDDYNLIDVRQPGEYRGGHIPGAQLIPMAELDKKLGQLDPDKPTLVY